MRIGGHTCTPFPLRQAGFGGTKSKRGGKIEGQEHMVCGSHLGYTQMQMSTNGAHSKGVCQNCTSDQLGSHGARRQRPVVCFVPRPILLMSRRTRDACLPIWVLMTVDEPDRRSSKTQHKSLGFISKCDGHVQRGKTDHPAGSAELRRCGLSEVTTSYSTIPK